MNRPDDPKRSVPVTAAERAAVKYLDALESGDVDAVAAVWAEAGQSPELERLLCDLSEGLAGELGFDDDRWQVDVDRLKRLIEDHLPPPPAEPAELTASDVATRLQADPGIYSSLTAADKAANGALLTNRTPIPPQLGAPDLERWVRGLGVSATPRYWAQFRKAAVLMAMGRSQRAGELAAARKAQPPGKGAKS